MLGPPRFETGKARSRAGSYAGDRPSPGRWPIAACVGVALIGPTVAIAAGKWWGTVAGLTVTAAGVLAFALLVSVAVRQREIWFRTRARQEAARRAAMDVAGPALHASDG